MYDQKQLDVKMLSCKLHTYVKMSLGENEGKRKEGRKKRRGRGVGKI